ncbi:FAD-binding domain-containing protein [uncultured Sphingomonas sp.]|uniref:FAD-binding domain-containing protein n=1 Tax=uncultured Sphingomonas sp. TaxID=158754 RepID=UPI0025D4710D|nr:FAD-binding domain-containing protein [uncultured Sphingomonas sp.]
MLLSAPGRGPILSFDFPLSRSTAEARLSAFLPHAGAAYTEHRNEDQGPGRHHAVSRLSAALRRRLVSEEEVARAVVARHGVHAAAKFLAELFWRTYWKGWLEQHPAIWRQWRGACAAWDARGMPEGYEAAIDGRTGIDAFDGWVRELLETGYLHNWARMQFASIWIFTLGLPWELGAAFTFDHFVDADAASNTLSWRWVAGLHTNRKPYLADPDRIRERTGGRYRPDGLARNAAVPRETSSASREPLRTAAMPTSGAPTLILLTPEDLSLETEHALAQIDVRHVVACRSHCRGPGDIAAVADGLQRAASHWRVPAAWFNDLDGVFDLAREQGVRQILTGYATVGTVADALAAAVLPKGLTLAEHQRLWDARAWPHCGKGYFALGKQIPSLLAEAGIV